MEHYPFHEGELRAQQLAGGGSGGAAIRPFMPDQHRLFFAGLRYLFVGALDDAGWPVATVLTGEPGFVQSPHPQVLVVDGLPDHLDPVGHHLKAGAPIGLLGLDLATRRRNRANGRIGMIGEDGIGIAINQSFGNCPQYIQIREVRRAAPSGRPSIALQGLDQAARDMIARADTLFVATSSGAVAAHGGVDISHRGGLPGFVRIDGDVLTIPDFRGNRYFNTLGNMLVEPRAALLFVDFERGDVLQLQGRTEIVWEGADVSQLTGAERVWRFAIETGFRREAALPLRFTFSAYAAQTVRTGIWEAR